MKYTAPNTAVMANEACLLYTSALRVAAVLLNAYLPSTAPKLMEQLGLDASALDLSKTVYGVQETYTCLLYTSATSFHNRCLLINNLDQFSCFIQKLSLIHICRWCRCPG